MLDSLKKGWRNDSGTFLWCTASCFCSLCSKTQQTFHSPYSVKICRNGSRFLNFDFLVCRPAVSSMLDSCVCRILTSRPGGGTSSSTHLTNDEMTTVKQNLQSQKIVASEEMVSHPFGQSIDQSVDQSVSHESHPLCRSQNSLSVLLWASQAMSTLYIPAGLHV